MTDIYLIRHAECEANVNMTFAGHNDCDITRNGERQLERLSERFRDIHIDMIYSSPLIRTMKTAQAVNYYHNIEIVQNKDLIEINGGVFEGKLWDDIPKLYPHEYELWMHNQPLFIVPEGDSMVMVYKRITNAILKIVQDNVNSNVAVVSHGCAIRNFLCFATKTDFKDLDSIKWCENTGVSKITFNDNSTYNVDFINDDSHLTKELLTLGNQVWWNE